MSNIVQVKKGESETSGNVRFPTGEVVITARARELLRQQDVDEALRRHVHGDWGAVAESVKRENEQAVQTAGGVISEYEDANGIPFYVITQPGWAYTLILLRDEVLFLA